MIGSGPPWRLESKHKTIGGCNAIGMRQVVHNRSIGKGFGMVMDSRGLATDDKDQMVITNDKRHHGANTTRRTWEEARCEGDGKMDNISAIGQFPTVRHHLDGWARMMAWQLLTVDAGKWTKFKSTDRSAKVEGQQATGNRPDFTWQICTSNLWKLEKLAEAYHLLENEWNYCDGINRRRQ